MDLKDKNNSLTRTQMDKVKLSFSEMGCPSEKTRQEFNNKLHFDFSYKDKIEIEVSNNTKSKELCQTGVKLVKK